ncbi:MAG TPA: EAL domain-containing protein [Candidatus Saccharimonadia bacterium]|nr:EAL domain-containing protein [Candidatus Saccharimonadia bacterium]
MKRSGNEPRDIRDEQTGIRELADRARARITEALAALDPNGEPARNLREAQLELERMLRDVGSIETRYRSLLDAVPDAVTLHDRNGRILDANDTACRSYGYPLEVLRELDVHDLNPLLPPDHMDEVWRTFRLGQTVTVEEINVRGDGSEFPVEVHSSAFLDGNEKRVVAIARDITMRKHAEDALKASEARYRQLLDSIDKGILVQDAEGRIVSANAAAARFLGASEPELIAGVARGEDWSLVDANGRRIAWEALPGARALHTRAVIESTLIGVSSARLPGYRWFSVTAVPQFLEGQERAFQVISMFSDVTDLKRQSEMFRQTQALASIGGWERDLTSGALHLSEEIYRLFDLPPASEMSWATMTALFAPADAERLAQSIEDLRKGGPAFDLELRIAAGARQRRWLRVLGRSVVHRGLAQGVSGTMQDITLRKVQEEQLRRQAMTDPLTGLANRDALLRALSRAVDEATPSHGPVLLYIDLDRFKVINDLLGHAAGDGLLVAAAQRLKDAAGPEAFVARFGGDEFIVMLPWIDDASVSQRVAEDVTAAFGRAFDYAGEEFTITTSVGVAQYPDDGGTIQQLINHADAAMYDAKRRGRNKWQPFSRELARELTDRLLIETQLRRALDNNELYLRYQPIVDLSTGRAVGAESLLRWRNRMLGELAPDVFIPHAENTGDIVRIGAWVIRQSLRQMREWRAAHSDIVRVAVNVSYRQFLSESLVDVVQDALREFDLPGEALELEMTERVLIEDVADTLDTFERLKRLGVKLVIDDFGEGYSALNYLRRLPVDGIKISHGFMHGIPADPTDTAVCEAIIDIAQSLRLTVIGEGVENEQQRAFLLSQGVTLAQGFLFARPLSAADIAEYARRKPA